MMIVYFVMYLISICGGEVKIDPKNPFIPNKKSEVGKCYFNKSVPSI